jgi:hypothetical protein
MADTLSITQWRVTDDNDDPVPGAKAYFYLTGTTTAETVYQDAALTIAHDTPVLADANGIFPAIYHDGTCKVNILTADDVQVSGYPQDPVAYSSNDTATASGVSFAPSAANPETNVQDAIDANATAIDANATAIDANATAIDANATAIVAATANLPRNIAYNAVDSYAFMCLNLSNAFVAAGTTYAGSSLYFAGLSATSHSTSATTRSIDSTTVNVEVGPGTDHRVFATGTWMAQGATSPNSASDFPVTLFKRIA